MPAMEIRRLLAVGSSVADEMVSDPLISASVMNRHTWAMRRSERDPTTRTALDTANATFLAVIGFGLLVGISTQLENVRLQAPWAVDPYDAVASFAMLFVPIVAVITWVRCVRWRHEAVYPSFAIVEIIRGCVVSLFAVAVTDAAYLAAVAQRGFPSDAPLRAELLGLLGLSFVTVAVASLLAVPEWLSQRRSRGARTP